MIKQIFFTLLAVVSLSSITYSQSFCLQFVEISNNGSNYVVELQMAGNADFNLGTSNLEFTYNTAGLANPVFVSSPLNFATGYQIPTVTRPNPGSASFNIELAFVGFGTTIGTGFTPVGQISFDILDQDQTSGLVWSYTGGTTQTVVFLNDNDMQLFATELSCLTPLNSLLPLELLEFTAKRQGESSQLNWTTAWEQGTSHFEVEHSTDARQFSLIGKVAAGGDTFSEADYHYWHEQPSVGDNYYRLRMVDLDGSYQYSPVAKVVFDKSMAILQVYPNPTQGLVQLRGTRPALDRVEVRDAVGRLLVTYRGTTTQLDLSSYPSGLYYLLGRDLAGQELWRERVIRDKF